MSKFKIKMTLASGPHYLKVQAYGIIAHEKSVDLIGDDGKTVVATITVAHGVNRVEYLGPVPRA